MESNFNQMDIDRMKEVYATDAKANISYFEWRDLGIARGWISEPFCDTHDAGPITEEEEEAWENGEDPCMFVFRIYEEKINDRLLSSQESLFEELI
jgi:hypothetical protein